MPNTYGRQVVVPLTNKSGGGVIAGDVVIVDTSNNGAFTTTSSAAVTNIVGVAQATIADNATGPVLLLGYAALINTTASVTRGNYGTTSTTVKKAVDAGSSRITGAFCKFLTGGTTPDAIVFNPDLGGAALTNPMDGTGQLIYGGAAGAPTKLAAGTTAQLLHGSPTVPSFSGLALTDILAATVDALLPWRIDIVPLVSTSNTNWNTISHTTAVTLAGLMLSSLAQNDEINFDVVLAAGTWTVTLIHTKDVNRGIYTVTIGGSSVGTIDGYAGSTAIDTVSALTGFVNATTGKYTLKLKMATKNASSSNYLGSIQLIVLTRTA